MDQYLPHTLALLARTPAALDALLRELPEAWITSNEGKNTWTVREIVGHLNHCERVDWLRRARIILEEGNIRKFEPLDREARPEGTLPELLDEFARLRAQNLAEVLSWNLSSAELARHGIHPVFGPVTLSQLLATWATHDLTHLHQISRVMAHQYREAVGPWSAYLGVLHCNGHSDA